MRSRQDQSAEGGCRRDSEVLQFCDALGWQWLWHVCCAEIYPEGVVFKPSAADHNVNKPQALLNNSSVYGEGLVPRKLSVHAWSSRVRLKTEICEFFEFMRAQNAEGEYGNSGGGICQGVKGGSLLAVKTIQKPWDLSPSVYYGFWVFGVF